jgi:hypothetical protein
VAHSKPRVPVLGDVVLRSTEPTDEKKGEPISRFACHTAAGIARVQTSQSWLEVGHCVIEVLDERPHRGFPSQAVEWDVGRGRDVRHDPGFLTFRDSDRTSGAVLAPHDTRPSETERDGPELLRHRRRGAGHLDAR